MIVFIFMVPLCHSVAAMSIPLVAFLDFFSPVFSTVCADIAIFGSFLLDIRVGAHIIVHVMTTRKKAKPNIPLRVWLAEHPQIVAKLSARLNFSPSMIYRVLKGNRKSRRIAAALANYGAPGFENAAGQRNFVEY